MHFYEYFFSIFRQQRAAAAAISRFCMGITRIEFLIAALGLQACYFPQPPDPGIFNNSSVLRPGLEIYRGNQKRFAWNLPSRDRGNALFLTADSYAYNSIRKSAKAFSAEQKSVNVDDLVWWEAAPILTQLYDKITRITIDEAKYSTVYEVLESLEREGKSFDVYFLAHGIPNYLSSGEGYFLSYRELERMRGRYRNLNLVFLQSCYGKSLDRDFRAAGARHVISFSGENRNFFWIFFFLRTYRYAEIADAIRAATSQMEESLRTDFAYRNLLGAIGLSPDAYLSRIENPSL